MKFVPEPNPQGVQDSSSSLNKLQGITPNRKQFWLIIKTLFFSYKIKKINKNKNACISLSLSLFINYDKKIRLFPWDNSGICTCFK
jgi:hypothetical protein